MSLPAKGGKESAAYQHIRMTLNELVAHMQEKVTPIDGINLQSQCLRLDNDLHHGNFPTNIIESYESQWEESEKQEGITIKFKKRLLIAIKKG